MAVMMGCSSPPSDNVADNSNKTQNVSDNKPTISNSNTVISINKNEINTKLQSETDALLPLFNKMPQVPVYIKDEPIIKNGSETQRGVAYTTCVKKEPTLYIKKAFYEKANNKQLTNILKHELVHSWFCRQGIKTGHDERFRKKFKSIGGFGN
jgi:hypothetical protein